MRPGAGSRDDHAPKDRELVGDSEPGSLLCFLLLLFIPSSKRPFDRQFFMQGLNALAFLWLPVWLISALLAIASGLLGSRKWLYASLPPILSAWVSWTLLAGIPF
jgi:hypothetical protein